MSGEITIEQYRAAVDAACAAVLSGEAGRQRYEKAVAAALTSLGLVVTYEGIAFSPEKRDVPLICVCPLDERVYCTAEGCRGGRALDDVVVWAAATWRDVRLGDVVRPPGVEGAEAVVVALGPVNNWHASPSASEYRPNESPMEWSNVNVTLKALASGAEMTPPNGMLAGAAVEIRTTAGELAAIEALGGWTNRVSVSE